MSHNLLPHQPHDSRNLAMNTFYMFLEVTNEVRQFATLAARHWNSSFSTVFMNLKVTFGAQTFTTLMPGYTNSAMHTVYMLFEVVLEGGHFLTQSTGKLFNPKF